MDRNDGNNYENKAYGLLKNIRIVNVFTNE